MVWLAVICCLLGRTWTAVLPENIAIAVVTSSPVHEDRLPALAQAWVLDAKVRCAAVIVVSDVATRCEARWNDTSCVETTACSCSASHWGIPCKSACAFTELADIASDKARWFVRVMDDTFVDVDALAWHLSALDDHLPWYAQTVLSCLNYCRRYVGEMLTVASDTNGAVNVSYGFEAALGGAGWALSRPALNIAIKHIDLYHLLTWTMGCNFTDAGLQVCGPGGEWPLPETHRGRPMLPAGRGLKLRSPFADDIMWGTYMATLNIPTAGPAGFTQAPVDAYDGVPVCAGAHVDVLKGAAQDPGAKVLASAETCDSTRRIHDLGIVYSEALVASVGCVVFIASAEIA